MTMQCSGRADLQECMAAHLLAVPLLAWHSNSHSHLLRSPPALDVLQALHPTTCPLCLARRCVGAGGHCRQHRQHAAVHTSALLHILPSILHILQSGCHAASLYSDPCGVLHAAVHGPCAFSEKCTGLHLQGVGVVEANGPNSSKFKPGGHAQQLSTAALGVAATTTAGASTWQACHVPHKPNA